MVATGQEMVREKFFKAGFVRVLENLERPGILLWHFPGLESPGKGLQVLSSPGKCWKSVKLK